MAKPQLENGHTQIANELLEQLAKLYLSPNQWQVLLFIIRKTYGFKKKVDHIANSQIGQGTGLSKAVISRSLKKLQARDIIIRQKKTIGMQKDWEKWKLPILSTVDTKLTILSTNKVDHTVNQSCLNGQPELPKRSTKVDSPDVTQKKKETIQKKLYKRKHGEFNNVLLTDDEYNKLSVRFGIENITQLIDDLSIGIKSKGYQYKDHYATILNWVRRDSNKKKALPLASELKEGWG